MSNSVVVQARPTVGWSAPAFLTQASVLHERYSIFCGRIKKTTLPLIAKMYANSYIFDFDHALTDGYFPNVGIVFKTKLGKIAIVFPKFEDREVGDGTITDRALTIHMMGEVKDGEVQSILDIFLRHLPPAPHPAGNADLKWPHEHVTNVEPSGCTQSAS